MLKREKHMKNPAVVALFTLLAWGCTLSDAEAGPDAVPEADSPTETTVELGHAAEWIGATTSGIQVTVHPDPIPVRTGITVFQISFEDDVPDDVPVSIDVISPEMPVMGLMRYAAERAGPNTYTVSAEISMDGAWEIYVNLGDGTDSAPFAFGVQLGDVDGNDHTGGHDQTVGVADAPAAHEIGSPETESHGDHDHSASK
jgi:hypothetical protein